MPSDSRLSIEPASVAQMPFTDSRQRTSRIRRRQSAISQNPAAVIVRGTLDESPDRAVLWIRAQEFHAPIFDQRITIPATAKLKQLIASPHQHLPTLTWINQEHPPTPNVEPAPAGKNSVGEPSCIYCPPTPHADHASIAKVQGTVTLDVVITADASPHKSESSGGCLAV
jgi:hypothetical protein